MTARNIPINFRFTQNNNGDRIKVTRAAVKLLARISIENDSCARFATIKYPRVYSNAPDVSIVKGMAGGRAGGRGRAFIVTAFIN